MPELDLHRSLSEIAYAAGVASHPERAANLRGVATRRRRRRTALVAAGSAVIVAATAVGALALSPLGDDATQPVAPPSTDSPSAPTPSETPRPPTPTSPSGEAGLATDPFLTDSTVTGELGDAFQPGFIPGGLELECWPGLDLSGAENVQLKRWLEQGPTSLSEYVMEYDTVAAADAAVSMTGEVWTACVPPELDFGGSLSGPSALSARDEAFEYTTTQPQTAEAEAFYREVKIARQGRVVVVIDLFVDGAPPAEAYLSQSIATRALERATDASRVASATPTPDPGWLRSRDLPTRPGTQWADGVVTSRRSDFGFTVVRPGSAAERERRDPAGREVLRRRGCHCQPGAVQLRQ